MAEKKVSDMLYFIIFGIFIAGAFSAIILSFDNQYANNANIGGDIEGLYNSSSSQYQSTEVSLQQDTFNTSSYSISPLTDVDPRGTSQTIQTARKSPAIMRNFVNSAATFFNAHKYIIIFISSLIILSGIVVILRFINPTGT